MVTITRSSHTIGDDQPSPAIGAFHAFVPDDLRAAAVAGGLTDVRVRGEELVANWFGWFNRTVEATAEYDDIPWMWRQYAFRGYLALQTVDRVLLEPRLPAGIFYNLMLTARRS